MERVHGTKARIFDVTSAVLGRTVERDQVEVTDHCPSLGERLAADFSCSPQDLDSAQLAGDDGLLGTHIQPLAQRRSLILFSDQLHQR
jgi:hypothetical protein